MANGHPEARDYPVSMVWEEAELVVERVNGMLASEGSILQAAASVAVAAFGKDGGKKAHAEFVKLMERLGGLSDDAGSGKVNLTEKIAKERAQDGRKRYRPRNPSP